MSGGCPIDARRLGLPLAFASEHEVVVVKPAGIAVELTSDPKGVSLISRMRRAAPEGVNPRLPHRLDRVTRGLVVVALTDEAIDFHNRETRDGAWEKLYLARIAMTPTAPVGELIGEHKAYLRREKMRARVVRSGGKPSRLTVLDAAAAPGRRNEAHALIQLHTGRFHQIRVMLSALGAPLVGDGLYGGPPGELYLEHVLLRFTPFNAEAPIIVHVEHDPDRERLDARIGERLTAEAQRAQRKAEESA